MYLCLSLGTSRGSVKAGLTAYLRKTASNSRSLALRHAFYPVIRPLVSHVRSTGATAAVGRLSCRASGDLTKYTHTQTQHTRQCQTHKHTQHQHKLCYVRSVSCVCVCVKRAKNTGTRSEYLGLSFASYVRINYLCCIRISFSLSVSRHHHSGFPNTRIKPYHISCYSIPHTFSERDGQKLITMMKLFSSIIIVCMEQTN